MKIIREGVFETNSSSSHSLTIKKRTKPRVNDIPRGVDSFLVNEYGVCCCSDESVDINRHYTQVAKLSFLLNMLATVCNYCQDWDLMFKDYSYDDYRSAINKYEYMTQFWEEMINSPYFTILQDVVFEETGTHIEFARPDSDDIPFYDCVYTDDGDVDELLGFDIKNFDAESYKKRLKEILFDEDMVIIDASIPYGIEGDWDV